MYIIQFQFVLNHCNHCNTDICISDTHIYIYSIYVGNSINVKENVVCISLHDYIP